MIQSYMEGFYYEEGNGYKTGRSSDYRLSYTHSFLGGPLQSRTQRGYDTGG